MSKRVVVTANEDGDVVIPSTNNPVYGYVRVEQERDIFDETSGWLKSKKVSALIPGTVKELKALGWYSGQEIAGKIVVKESLTPFNKKDPEKNIKIAGETGVVCSVGGEPIYRNNFYTPNPAALDILVPHDNSDEIIAANATLEHAGEGKELEL